MRSCPRCGRTVTERATFCADCGVRLAGTGEQAPQARKVVTVLFADVSGFTALSERLDPESLQEVMTRYFGAMCGVVERHGGKVEKFIGDSVMALFGVPVLHEDDALRAARAALEMRDALDGLNQELSDRWDVHLRMHSGLNTGEVVISRTPDGHPLTYGDPVNVAQRLEGAAAPGEILAGPGTVRLLRGAARFSAIAPLHLKGQADAVAACRLEAVGPGEEPGTAPGPMVGRTRELDRVRGAFDRVARNRRPEMVTVLGPAGIGKSRLLRELAEQLAEQVTVVGGGCLPYGEGITYWPLVEMVRRLTGRADEAAVAALAGEGAEGRRIASRIARAAGLASGGVSVDEAHWAVRRLLEINAERRPLIVVVDDIHWAEPALLDVLEHVVTFAAPVPLLIVCLSRPELLDRRPDWGQVAGRSAIVPVEPLRDEDAAALLRQLAPAGAGAADAARLLATAEGNPFFLEQMVAMRAEPEGSDVGTPATIQALLAARIDALAPAERALIDRAAVEGRSFHRRALAELLDGDADGLDEALAALVRRQLIRHGRGELPGEDGYRFAHVLVRDVAYELLPKATRATLHERYARWLQRRPDGGGQAERIGFHLEQAHRCHAELHPGALPERHRLALDAAHHLGAAGTAALGRDDLAAGAGLLERAAAILPEDDPARGALMPELGMALVLLGALPRADRVLTDAATGAAANGDELAAAHARTARFFALLQVDPESAADEIGAQFERLLRTFAGHREDVGLSRLWRARALVLWLSGRSAEAEAAWTRAVRHARLGGDEKGRADALGWLASAACHGPTPVPAAIARCTAIIEQLRADRRSQALSLRPLAMLHAMAGDIAAARALLERSEAIDAELGVTMHGAAAQEAGVVAMLAGDPAAAEAVLRPGYEQLEEMGERALLSTTAAELCEAVRAQGRDDEARALLDVASDAAAPDDLSAQILIRCVAARLLARDGAAERADQVSAEAVGLAARTDWLIEHANALMVRGDVLRTAGRTEDAGRALGDALRLYERKGNVVGAQRAREAAAVVAA